MITIKLTLDKRRKRTNGTYPIVFCITFKGDARYLKTSYSTKENEWNFKGERLKETHQAYDVIAPELSNKYLHYLGKINAFEKAYPTCNNIQEIKEFLISKKQNLTDVYSFWEEEIRQLYKANRNGGAQVYKEALIAVNKIKSLQIPFEALDYNFLKEVETEFLSRGVKLNTIGIHYREMRAIYNKAIKAKIVTYEYYPFRDYKIKKEKTRPRTISLIEMKSYFSLNIDKTSYLHDSWLMGQFMFMLIGINFKDMIMLTEADLKADRVFYRRAKTKKLYSIKLLPRAKEIIEHFRPEESLTLLGKLTKGELENKTRFTLLIRQKNKVFNAHLNKLGKMIGCKEKLTGYVFRYTWANCAKQLDFSKDLIAEALGHEYGNKVTGIYLEGYDLEFVDEMNEKIYHAMM